MTEHPAFVLADNPGLFTLDGTRSYLVGRRHVVIIDPGPDVESHVRALASAVGDAETLTLLLTHEHSDHAAAAPRLAEALGAEVMGPSDVEEVTIPLVEGDSVETDDGALVAVDTPGHTEKHLAFHWPAHEGVFVGDLLLGRGDTTWVAEYPGCVQDYLDSLRRLDGLQAKVLYPTHGPPLTEPGVAIRRFREHRLERIAQVREARAAHPDADINELLDVVYGDTVASSMRGAAARSLEAVLQHLDVHG